MVYGMRLLVLVLFLATSCGQKDTNVSEESLYGCWSMVRSLLEMEGQVAEMTPKEGETLGVCFTPGSFEYFGEPGPSMIGALVIDKVEGSVFHVLMDGQADQIRVQGDVIYIGLESEGFVTEYRRK